MKTYIANYNSPNNIFKGELVITSKDHKEAMGRVFDWVKTKEVWNHLWAINIEIREVESETINDCTLTNK